MTEKIWDPLRKKYVASTPEEDVRQWFISQMKEGMQIPLHMMMSEVGLTLGKKKFRADIIVYDRSLNPLMIVECKKSDITLDQKVIDQTVTYNLILDVKYIVITNGRQTYILKKSSSKERSYEFLQTCPTYLQMLEE